MGADLYEGINPEIIILLLSITEFSQLLNETKQGVKLDPMDYAESVIIRLHRLLHLAPLGSQRLVEPLDKLVHVSLIATMTTLLPEYGHNLARYHLLAEELRRALQTYAAPAEHNDRVFLWAVFVSFATFLDCNDHGWLAVMARDICVRLGLHSWADVRSILCQYAWIHVLYNTPGLKLWNMLEIAV